MLEEFEIVKVDLNIIAVDVQIRMVAPMEIPGKHSYYHFFEATVAGFNR